MRLDGGAARWTVSTEGFFPLAYPLFGDIDADGAGDVVLIENADDGLGGVTRDRSTWRRTALGGLV
ncbi:MAG TPA: hypothetical protein VMM13_10650 [Euzebya sp.]|nr:hypothetical protein [Euzebya sp.]